MRFTATGMNPHACDDAEFGWLSRIIRNRVVPERATPVMIGIGWLRLADCASP